MSNVAHEVLLAVKNVTRKIENNLNALVRATSKIDELKAEIAEARAALADPDLSMELFNQFTRQGQSAHRRTVTAEKKVEELTEAHAELTFELAHLSSQFSAITEFPTISTVEYNKDAGITTDVEADDQNEEAA